MAGNLTERLRQRELLVGTWVKTPSPIVCEVLSKSNLDVLALDAEHAPFGRTELDSCLAICAAKGMPALVRVPSADPSHILNALDCGAAGVIVPHVSNPQSAAAAVKACHYGRGGRGYAGSTRAAGFAGRPIAEQLTLGRSQSSVILQIEDVEAMTSLDEIAEVDGVDCLFVGRMDLTVSLGKTNADDPEVVAAVDKICAAGKRANVPVGMFVSDPAEAKHWIAKGASLFVLGSDQTFLLSGARSLLNAVK